MKLAGYPDGCTQWDHDRAFDIFEEQSNEQRRVDSITTARDEIETCDAKFIEWVSDYKDAFELLPLLSAFYRAEFNSAALADLNKLKQSFVNEYAEYVYNREEE